MKEYEKVKGGVKKSYSWGYSIVYGAFEDCFTTSELIQVLKDYQTMADSGAIDPKTDKIFLKLKAKAKAKADADAQQ